MAERKYFTATEVKAVLHVTDRFLDDLEAEEIVRSMCEPGMERRYPREEAEKIRFASILVFQMGVNLEGVEVALRLRDTLYAMRLQMDRIVECLVEDIRKEISGE